MHELDLLCCSVTKIDTNGQPTWFAAVSPNNRVCAVEETIFVPLPPHVVKTVLLCAHHLRSQANCATYARAIREALCAQRRAKDAPLIELSQLALGPVRPLLCANTCVALLGSVVARQKSLPCQTPERSRFEFERLPPDIQLMIAAFCATHEEIRIPDIARVNRVFHACACKATLVLSARLRTSMHRCDAKAVVRTGEEIGCRGMWPLRLARRKPAVLATRKPRF